LIGAARAVSKNELDFALIESNKVLFHLEVSNDKKGIEQFIKQIKTQYKGFSMDKCLFCMEHTGIYNNPLLNYLHLNKADAWLEQATQIKSSMGVSREKNDKVDSQKIGLYARAASAIKTVKMLSYGHLNVKLLLK
jgi:transposase